MKRLITAALPYANGPIHFGHIAGAYLPADVYARFSRLAGHETLFIGGSDEYGVAITLSAEVAGRTPKEHVDHFHAINKGIFEKIGISYDHYSRTTWKGHIHPVQQFFLDLYHNGHIEAHDTEQLYSEKDSKFLADRYVVGTCPKCGHHEARGDECPKCGASYEATDIINPKSKVTGHPLIRKKTKHWFLRFDHFKEPIREFLLKKEWKSSVLRFALPYAEELKMRAITRDSDWGIPVPLPEAEGKVLYVWFDAPIGYISATQEWAETIGAADAWKEWWLSPSVQYTQFIGKDNIPFHAIFFPAMCMGQNTPYKLVDNLPANEFFHLEGKQFSKSSGWYIDVEEFLTQFSVDQLRYYLASRAPENHDSEFSFHDFGIACNSELVGKFGNFVNRVVVFIHNTLDSITPFPEFIRPESKQFIEEIDRRVLEAYQAYDRYELRKATHILMELASVSNVFFDAEKPWKLAKDPNAHEQLKEVIAACLYAVKALALVAMPIVPAAAKAVFSLLHIDSQSGWASIASMQIPGGMTLSSMEVLFQKVDEKLLSSMKEALSQELQKKANSKVDHFAPRKGEISYDDFAKLDFRVGIILEAKKVEKSQKLLQLQVDLGFEKRQIVSGIALHYTDPSELIGKKVAVVANLKPAKILGIESQGMLLAASFDKDLTLLDPGSIVPGGVIS